MRKLLYVSMSPFFPDSSGGAELSILFLLKALSRRGWQVGVFCAFLPKSPLLEIACLQELKRLKKSSFLLKDEDLGFPCWRFISDSNNKEIEWLTSLDDQLKKFQPDIILGYPSPLCPLLNFSTRQGYPCFYYAHNLAVYENNIAIPRQIHVIANAPITAKALSKISHKKIGVVHVIIERDLYKVGNREKKHITFINPIQEKGIDIATRVAQILKEESFLFVKGGWLGFSEDYLTSLISTSKLSNVEVWDHQINMRSVYSVTDVLFVPSQFFETFGRVIVEAHINGIPVVAADVGGIPYTIGEGGILVKPIDKPEGYVGALNKLRTDEDFYKKISEAAIRNSMRPEFDPTVQINNFIQFVESRIRR